MKINLTKEDKLYIEKEVASGRYKNTDELFKEALLIHKILKTKQKEDLKSKIKVGWDSEDSNIYIRDIINAKIKE